MYATPSEKHAILVASSDEVVRRQLLDTLESAHYAARAATGGADALIKLEQSECEALVIDPPLHDLDVEEVISIAGERHPNLGVFVINPKTGEARRAGQPSAASAILLQALAHLELATRETAETRTSETEPEPVPEGPAIEDHVEPLPGMVGRSAALGRVYRLARLVARRETAVLLSGETGTGKELVARAIHELSPRGNRSFVVVNCAAIPETLLEAELFGYMRGAFTGAFQNHVGRIHTAHGGTLFLDEVGELPASMQVKLLRFLQEGEVQRLGSSDVFRVDVRVIAATNADLLQRIAERAFRQDLYYRLAVFPIEMPPLRERPEDIPPLAEQCVERLVAVDHRPKRFSGAALRLLATHSWPGNVRELQHVIERAVILSEDDPLLLPEHFPTPKKSEE